jgi:hypothetical protein
MLLVYFQRGRQDDEPFRHPAFAILFDASRIGMRKQSDVSTRFPE